ncbi:MAG: DUF5320 domain-containing protein [Armatimonadota bacterium]
MPGLDGTGPRGMGPMTGGGRGWCNPYSPMYAGRQPNLAAGAGAPGMVARGPYPMGAYGGWPGMGPGMALPFQPRRPAAPAMLAHASPYGYRPFGMGFGMRGAFGRGRGMCGGRGRGMWW